MAAQVVVDALLFAEAPMTDPFHLYLWAEAGLWTWGLKPKILVGEDVVLGQQI